MTCTCLYNNTAEGASSTHQADARCPEHGGKRMTTAEVFSDYLGLTPENAPWAYDFDVAEFLCLDVPPLTATSPLAPEPTPGWLEALVMRSHRVVLYGTRIGGTDYLATLDGVFEGVESTHPTHAVARALIAADPDLCARLEACEDWKEAIK